MQFTLEIYAAATNCKKNIKTPILEIQGHSRSLMFTPIKNLSLYCVSLYKQHVSAYLQPFSSYTSQ